MTSCLFCRFATGSEDVVIIHQDPELIAFLDIAPIRPGHTQIITRMHCETFDELPPALAGRMVELGQQLARRMKQVYQVQRVAFLFTGSDVPHVHAHIVPLHHSTDITSARYVVAGGTVRWESEHLRSTPKQLREVRDFLGFVSA